MNNSTNLLNSGVHQRKANTKSKTSSSKKKPVKVVYISNPMKVKTSASEFRALVQELTGQDSELPDPARFSDPDSDNNNNHFTHVNPTVNSPPNSTQIGLDEVGTILDQASSSQEQPESSNSNNRFDMSYDDVFLPEMIDSFDGLLPSTFLYESSSYTHRS